MADDLLRQAIADAKLVRDTAYANAKASLEESFRPQLAKELSAKLRTEATLDSSGIGAGLTVDEPTEKKPSAATSDSSHIENHGLEVEDVFDGPTGAPKATNEAFGEEEELGGEEEAGAPDMGGAPDMSAPAPTAAPAPSAPAAPSMSGPAPTAAPEMGAPAPDAGLGGAPEMGMGAPDAGLGGGQGDELDLEAIIRELEAEANGGMETPEPQLEGFDDVNCGKEVDGAAKVNETLSGQPEDGVSRDGKAPTAVDGVNGGKKVSPGQAVTGTKAETMTEGEDEGVNLEEILREMEAVDEDKSATIAAENVELKKSLREHREVVLFLKDKLQEVNMLNAKLLYTNKLFKNGSLSVEQKMQIVETFDRATTLREVKLIYSTLAQSSVKAAPKKAAVTPKAATQITEGLASKSVASTKPKSTQVLAENDEQRARMMKLAGIRIL